MILSNQWPLEMGPGNSRGYTGLIQGPATKDGVITNSSDPSVSNKSYQIVTDMLGKLATKDESWRPYWHKNMMWYGPGAFGSFVGLEEFSSFQIPFESQFEGWSGGSKNNGLTKHFTRFGDGNYTCSGGWPSLTGINVKSFLGQEPTNQRVFMRVCDWWRRENELLVENWVFVDVPHLLLQLGFNPLPAGKGLNPNCSKRCGTSTNTQFSTNNSFSRRHQSQTRINTLWLVGSCPKNDFTLIPVSDGQPPEQV